MTIALQPTPAPLGVTAAQFLQPGDAVIDLFVSPLATSGRGPLFGLVPASVVMTMTAGLVAGDGAGGAVLPAPRFDVRLSRVGPDNRTSKPARG